jgi:hypothetical protein
MSNEVRVQLGPVAIVRNLFSYPNNCHTICFLDQSLEETVTTYLLASMKRDGFTDSIVKVETATGNVFALISGSAAQSYADMLPKYLAVGQLGLDGSRALLSQNKWRYNWRFFLPHGVSMARHLSVQLLHFPPDYVLERDQDYLLAHTTLRWAELLVENGADPATTAQYQNIIDIAPIAAPSNDGKNLDGIYGEYTPYINGLLNLWCPASDGGFRPLVAFGGPVRSWLKEQYNLDLSVLELSRLELSAALKIPVLAANHPSFIYNAVKRLEDDPTTPIDERVAIGMRVMQQDLIVAMWQVEMSREPTADPTATLSRCKLRWEDPSMQKRICELTYTQTFDKTSAEAAKLCAQLPLVKPQVLGVTREFSIDSLDRRIESLRKELGAAESDKPEWFN